MGVMFEGLVNFGHTPQLEWERIGYTKHCDSESWSPSHLQS